MPTPISPNTGAPERVFAKDQPQYNPLPVACYEGDAPSTYLVRYQLSDAERAAIAAGADVFLSMLGHVAPHRVEIGVQEWMTPRLLPASPPSSERTILVVGERVLQLGEGENITLWSLAREDATGFEVQFTGAVGVPERFVGAILEVGAFQAQTCGRVFTFADCGVVSAEQREKFSVPDAMQLSYGSLQRSDL